MTLLEVIQKIARQIAKAEGFGGIGNLPTDANNPGDLKLGNRFPDVKVMHKGVLCRGTINGMTIFPKADWNADIEDRTDGCATLYREIRDVLAGHSIYYHPGMSIQQLADLWTKTDPQDWAKTVATGLGVTCETSLSDAVLRVGLSV